MNDIINYARRAEALIKINGAEVNADINDYLLSFTYIDNYDDKCDDLRLEIEGSDGAWLYNINKQASNTVENRNSVINTGDTVRVKEGAADFNGGRLAPFVYNTDFSVLEIGRLNPNRIVIGIDDAVTAAVHIDNLTKNGSGNTFNTNTAAETKSIFKGAVIEASVIQKNFNTDGKETILNCGTFQIDSINYSGFPSRIKINATSLSLSSPAGNQLKSRIWENIRLSNIVKTIANRNGLSFMYESGYDPIYERKEQSEETDIGFLQRLCEDTGLALKITSDMIVLFDEAGYESKDAALTISRNNDILNFSFSDNLNDTAYSSCRVSYTDLISGAVYEYTYTPRNNPGTGLVLEISEKVSSTEEARQLAMKRLRQKNRKETTASFRIPGNTSLVAGIAININGWGVFDGKYMVEKSEHTVYKTSGYTTTLEMHKVLEGY